jgi:phosphate transport system substrate-binding protein
MKKLACVFSAFVLMAGIAFAGGGQDKKAPAADQSAPQTSTISVGGSTSVNPLMELFIAEYTKANSNVKFTLSATGSGDGIKGVPAGTCEIGMSSRDLTPAEKGTDIQELVVAIDGIAVVVNSRNPVSGLTIDQIRDIYTGAVSRWEELGAAANGKTGGIAVVSREPGSGTRGAFEEIVKFQDKLVQGAIEFDGTGAIKAEVSRNVDAIGYISLGSVDNTIKALSVEGVAASTANVKNNTYKIARPFILMTRKSAPPAPAVKAFLDWCMSGEGQALVQRNFISVL